MIRNDSNISVGQKLYKARKILKMSRTELGRKLNLHETTIKRYEDGDIKSLCIGKMHQFAHVLNISPEYLLGWEDSSISSKDTTIALPLADATSEEVEELEAYLKWMRKRDEKKRD